MSIITIENLAKSFMIPSVARDTVREQVFGLFRSQRMEELRALDGVSFTVERGGSVGIMGRNGSGKTTLMRILAGIYQPDRGSVSLKVPLTPILGLGVGWNETLAAVDNVCLLGTVMGIPLCELKAGMDEILAFAGLQRFASLPLRHYSSGMKVRLAFAVAFRSVNEIVLLDEVFSVGDVAYQNRCRGRCLELKKEGNTFLLVSHDPAEIASFCDRALLLEQGTIVMDDEPGRVVEAYVELMESSTNLGATPGAATAGE